jgi:hypothetical protein
MDTLVNIIESSESDYDDADAKNVEYGAETPEDMLINHKLPSWKALLFRTSSSLGMQFDMCLESNATESKVVIQD